MSNILKVPLGRGEKDRFLLHSVSNRMQTRTNPTEHRMPRGDGNITGHTAKSHLLEQLGPEVPGCSYGFNEASERKSSNAYKDHFRHRQAVTSSKYPLTNPTSSPATGQETK